MLNRIVRNLRNAHSFCSASQDIDCVTGWIAKGPYFDSYQEQDIYIFCKTYRSRPWLTHPPKR